ncbi:rna 3-terminal phosphate cyclase [Stylonychia lemnae]|uniref:Rna 3-terminal phosphate cyclase n=1 Tax=Stylonychia lemnae TaxID=5949 RepID=A0A078AJQ9_STYLE|nr:rna 3-terminal phosphate cyclase [Stylonychia lemnae]|eukprot:CDW82404.1 rna 3-terminal phosphate cyclase [Stylonychia lemnae]
MTLALSYLLRKKIKISKIRANRGKGGGLGNQHLTGVQLQLLKFLAKFLDQFIASMSSKGEYQKTPGSTHLVAQMLLPCLIFQNEKALNFYIKGGTLVGMSPTCHSYERVLIPTLKMFNIQTTYEVINHGLFPDLVGQIKFQLQSSQEQLTNIQFINRGELKSIDIFVSSTAGPLLSYYEDDCKNQILNGLAELVGSVPININEIDLPINTPKYSKAQTLLITAVLNFENPTCLSASILVEKSNLKKQDHVQVLLQEIKELIQNNLLTTDEYHTDQLMIFMALAKGKSSIICKELSLHSQTMIELLKMFFGDRIQLEVNEITKDTQKAFQLDIDGVEKILNEFAVRLNKSRTQLQEVCNQVETLKKESNKLQRQLDEANQEKAQAERLQEELKHKYINTKVCNEEESEKHQQEQNELNNLRKLKRKLVKEKELAEKDCEKLSNELQQHIHDRKELESLAKRLSEQLEQVQGEKQGLMDEYTNNQQTINDYNIELKELKDELESMKNVIAHTFEDELKTANSMNVASVMEVTTIIFCLRMMSVDLNPPQEHYLKNISYMVDQNIEIQKMLAKVSQRTIQIIQFQQVGNFIIKVEQQELIKILKTQIERQLDRELQPLIQAQNIRLREPSGAVLKSINRSIKLPDESFTYGKSLRPSTPIKDVVCNFYADVAEQQMLSRYQYLRQQSRSGTRLSCFERHTKASALAKDHIENQGKNESIITRDTRTLFKMKKFQNVAPRTNTNMGKRANLNRSALE